jgi:hypothetical protein
MQFLVTTNDIIAGRMFCRIAEELRATVEFRDDAKSSLATLEQQRFDVVLIDCDDVSECGDRRNAFNCSASRASPLARKASASIPPIISEPGRNEEALQPIAEPAPQITEKQRKGLPSSWTGYIGECLAAQLPWFCFRCLFWAGDVVRRSIVLLLDYKPKANLLNAVVESGQVWSCR